jgi:coenzyme F420-reducing hydrogenase delta subunit
MGFEPERVEMFNLSSSDGPKFAAIATEMAERAYKLGPSKVKRQARQAWEISQAATSAA